MDRAEATGFGVAAAGHVALAVALSLGFAATRLKPPPQQPIEVSFIDEAAPVSSAPDPSPAAPAPKLAPVEGPVVPSPAAAPPVPAPPVAQPLPPSPRPQPVHAATAPAPAVHRPPPPAPAPSRARPAPAPQPARPAPSAARKNPTGRLTGLLNGLSDTASPSRSASSPAATASPAVKSSLIAEIKRQLKPKWQQVVPSGADVDSLRTELSVSLARDGSVTHVGVVGTTGVTASNKPQVSLHQERARKAVMLASPFHLPPDVYDAWKQVAVTLDLRLSQ